MLKWLIVFSQSLLDADTNPLLKAGVLKRETLIHSPTEKSTALDVDVTVIPGLAIKCIMEHSHSHHQGIEEEFRRCTTSDA